MPAGRPTDYKESYAEQAKKLCILGATDVDLAEFFDVSVRTIPRWATKYPEFCQALKAGKDTADQRVERSLYQRAVGYSHSAVKIFMPAGAKKPVYAEYLEHSAPDTTAAIFWLKNRKSAEWRDTRFLAGDQENPLAIKDVTSESRLEGFMAFVERTKR
jgi:hypothetical protein